MKISVVHSFYDDRIPSGENSTVKEQVEELQKHHDVQLISRRTADLRRVSASSYLVKSAMYAAGWLSDDSVRAEIDRFRPDVVHVHNVFPNIGVGAFRSFSYPLVATMHNYRFMCASGLLWRDGNDCRECLDRGSQRSLVHSCYRGSRLATLPLALSTRNPQSNEILRAAGRVVCLNDFARSRYEELVGPEKVVVLPNFAYTLPELENASCGDRSGFIFAGRLSPEKGLAWLLDFWPQNGDELTVAGVGELEALVSTHPNPQIKYIGRVSKEELLRRLSAARGLIVPSLWSEGIPTVAIEGLSVGTPVLSSSSCVAGHLLSGDDRLVFDMSDGGESLRRAISVVKDRSGSLANNPSKIYSTNFSPSVWLRGIEGIYREVLDL